MGSSGKALYLDVPHLANEILVYDANTNISAAKISSSCPITSKFLTSSKTLYFFEVDFSQAGECKNGNIVLELAGEKIASSLFTLNIKSSITELLNYWDYSSEALRTLSTNLEKTQKKYAIYKNYKRQDIVKYYAYLQGQRRYFEAQQQYSVIQSILVGREKKYLSPVIERNISETFTKIPNSPRPYRADYTDGIHHGWDIGAPIGTDIVALDDGVIVRVVALFSPSDFSRIVYGNSLSDEQKLKNLDILRGRQIWLKTMKGDVVFYSHLDTVLGNIHEGMKVTRGEKMGTVGISWVPEEGYEDSHLHFEIAKNPYIFETAGTYDFGDYMAWPWATKGMNEAQTVQAQKDIFE